MLIALESSGVAIAALMAWNVRFKQ